MRESPLSTCYPKLKSGRKHSARRVGHDAPFSLSKPATSRPFSFMSKSDKQSETRRISDAKKSGREQVLAAYDEIVEKLVEQAKQASVPHAKLCFELLDARSRKTADDDEDEDCTSLAEYILEQLQLEPLPEDHPNS